MVAEKRPRQANIFWGLFFCFRWHRNGLKRSKIMFFARRRRENFGKNHFFKEKKHGYFPLVFAILSTRGGNNLRNSGDINWNIICGICGNGICYQPGARGRRTPKLIPPPLSRIRSACSHELRKLVVICYHFDDFLINPFPQRQCFFMTLFINP